MAEHNNRLIEQEREAARLKALGQQRAKTFKMPIAEAKDESVPHFMRDDHIQPPSPPRRPGERSWAQQEPPAQPHAPQPPKLDRRPSYRGGESMSDRMSAMRKVGPHPRALSVRQEQDIFVAVVNRVFLSCLFFVVFGTLPRTPLLSL